jgi:ABC-type uncharacterized transport system ATPase subunit
MTIISANELSKVFAWKIRAVDGLNLEIDRGEIFGFLGPNGAGKTNNFENAGYPTSPRQLRSYGLGNTAIH